VPLLAAHRSGGWHPVIVHLYFDESGDFAFPADSFDVYVQPA
jgi:hypothetical protein